MCIRDRPHIIVGTPGRVLDLMNKKKIASHQIKTIVIDEGDNLLDNTSSNFVKDIVKKTMRDRQLLIFSATISNKTLSTAKELMKDPIIYKNKQQVSLNPNIEHYYIEVDQREKVEVLRKLLSAVNPEKALVFVNKSFDINIVKMCIRDSSCTIIPLKKEIFPFLIFSHAKSHAAETT